MATTLTALDRGRFLANNEGWYTFRGAAPEEAVRAPLRGLWHPGRQPGGHRDGGEPEIPGVALDKIVDGLYTLAARQNGRRYLSRFQRPGELEVVEKPETAALELAPGKNLQSLRVTEDISKLRNTVGIYSQTGARVRTVSDAGERRPVRAVPAHPSPSGTARTPGRRPRRTWRTTASSRL